jgi:hypothetical protein
MGSSVSWIDRRSSSIGFPLIWVQESRASLKRRVIALGIMVTYVAFVGEGGGGVESILMTMMVVRALAVASWGE